MRPGASGLQYPASVRIAEYHRYTICSGGPFGRQRASASRRPVSESDRSVAGAHRTQVSIFRASATHARPTGVRSTRWPPRPHLRGPAEALVDRRAFLDSVAGSLRAAPLAVETLRLLADALRFALAGEETR
jgi:hypothetical protein